MGYGPARLFTKKETSQLSEALNEWNQSAFREKFHVKDMIAHEIYPLMDDEDEEEFFSYFWSCFA